MYLNKPSYPVQPVQSPLANLGPVNVAERMTLGAILDGLLGLMSPRRRARITDVERD